MKYLSGAGSHIEVLVRLLRCLARLSDVLCWLMAPSSIIRRRHRPGRANVALSVTAYWLSFNNFVNEWAVIHNISFICIASEKQNAFAAAAGNSFGKFTASIGYPILFRYSARFSAGVFEKLSVVSQRVLGVRINKRSCHILIRILQSFFSFFSRQEFLEK